MGKFLRRLYAAYSKWQEDDAAQMAAAMSYYMALSFFPLMLLLLAAMGIVLAVTGWGRDAQEYVLKLLADQVAPSLAIEVEAAISSVQSRAAVGAPLGLATLLVAALAIFAQLEQAFDRIWKTPRGSSRGIVATLLEILFHRFRAFLILLGLGVAVILVFGLTMALATIAELATPRLPIPRAAWNLSTLALAVLINWALFTTIYKLLPRTTVRWREAARGGFLASFIWEVGRRILATLVIGSHYSVYGVVGGFIAIMLWVYYASATLFFGAEYIQTICRHCSPAAPREAEPEN